jgi:hypothetical protein
MTNVKTSLFHEPTHQMSWNSKIKARFWRNTYKTSILYVKEIKEPEIMKNVKTTLIHEPTQRMS